MRQKTGLAVGSSQWVQFMLAKVAAAAGPIRADREEESADAAAQRQGFVGALPGQEGLAVPVPEAERTYDRAFAAAWEDGKPLSQEVTEASGRNTVVVTKGQRKVGEGLVQDVETRATVNAEGVKRLSVRHGAVKLDRGRVLGEVMAQATHGPWYNGMQVNGSIIRPIKALEEDAANGRYRVLSGWWDERLHAVPATAKVRIGPWKPAAGQAWKHALAEWDVNQTEAVPTGGESGAADNQTELG